MRKSHKKQLPLCQPTPDHPKAKEMTEISKILDQNCSIYDQVLQDISNGSSNRGAQGMTAEQVVRAAIVLFFSLFHRIFFSIKYLVE